MRPDQEIRDRFLEANGQTFHLLESGSSTGQLLIFLHGFPEYSGMWQEYLQKIGPGFHAVAPDLRGYNLSSKPSQTSEYRVSLLVEDIKALVGALGHTQAHLVAHDWGALIAWHAIAAFPETFLSTVIMNGPHPQIYADLVKHDPDQMKKSAYVGFLLLPFAAPILSLMDFALFRIGIFRGSRRPYTQEQKRGYQDAWKRGIAHPLDYYKANFKNMEQELRHVQPSHRPSLVLWGERDDYLSLHNLQGLEKWASRLTIKRYPDAGHWIQHEKFEEVLEDIQHFVVEGRAAQS